MVVGEHPGAEGVIDRSDEGGLNAGRLNAGRRRPYVYLTIAGTLTAQTVHDDLDTDHESRWFCQSLVDMLQHVFEALLVLPQSSVGGCRVTRSCARV